MTRVSTVRFQTHTDIGSFVGAIREALPQLLVIVGNSDARGSWQTVQLPYIHDNHGGWDDLHRDLAGRLVASLPSLDSLGVQAVAEMLSAHRVQLMAQDSIMYKVVEGRLYLYFPVPPAATS